MQFKIYYIDDETDLLEIFEDTFSSEDVCITTFDDPEIALNAIKQQPPHLMFVNYRLPFTNGVEFAKKVAKNIPVALITGDLSVEMETGFQKVFTKPYATEEVANFISSFKQQFRQRP